MSQPERDAHYKRSDKPRVLVVSRDKSLALLACRRLAKNGCDVDMVDNSEAKLASKPGYYDLALIDMNAGSSKANSFELYRHISSIDKKIKICFMTTFPVNKKEFTNVFPSVKVDWLLEKSKADSTEIDEMYSSLLH